MIFVDDLGNPEGPVLLSDNSWVVLEMRTDRGCLTHISADGKKRRLIAKTGRPNGLVVDKDGVLWVAESMNPPSLMRVTMNGNVETVVTECDGEPFLFPNDLCFGPAGALYMTDSGYPCKEWMTFTPDQKRAVQPDGRVYRIDPANGSIEKLDSAIPFANGIAFGPDQNLYVTGTLSGMVYRYAWQEGKVRERTDFGNVWDPNKVGTFCGPDGMAFGRDGNLYVAVVWQGDVTILGPDGSTVKRNPTAGMGPTNVAFGPSGSNKIYVTDQADGRFETFDVDTDGLPLFT